MRAAEALQCNNPLYKSAPSITGSAAHLSTLDKVITEQSRMYRVQQKYLLLSSVTHVPSGLMGCASAALGWWVGARGEIQTCLNFFFTTLYLSPAILPTLTLEAILK